jgi:hypothetical protein
MPCHPARARKLLNKGKAAIYRKFPFTIILKYSVDADLQAVEIKFDPGSRTTGRAKVGHFNRGLEVIWAGNLNHRGIQIKSHLEPRRAIRRSRRNRKTRYRQARFLNRLRKIQSQAQKPLKDAAAVNVALYAAGNVLKSFGLPIVFSTGGRTKFNRLKRGYQKDHWIDAACVSESGSQIVIPKTITPLTITAKGRGSRQQCSMNKYGFPRTGPKKAKRVKGFQTGDIVRTVVTKGKKIGTYIGRVAVRVKGSFDIGSGQEKVGSISHKYCRLIQRTDGYEYSTK